MDNETSTTLSTTAALTISPPRTLSPPLQNYEPSSALLRMQQLLHDLTPSHHGIPLRRFLPAPSARALAQLEEWEALLWLRRQFLDSPLSLFREAAESKVEGMTTELSALTNDQDWRPGDSGQCQLETLRSEIQYWKAELAGYEAIRNELNVQTQYWLSYRTRVRTYHDLYFLPELGDFVDQQKGTHFYRPIMPTNQQVLRKMINRITPEISRRASTSSLSPPSKLETWQTTY